MLESEEQNCRLLHEGHTRLAVCQEQKVSAIRELNACLSEAALREDYLLKQLHSHKVGHGSLELLFCKTHKKPKHASRTDVGQQGRIWLDSSNASKILQA